MPIERSIIARRLDLDSGEFNHLRAQLAQLAGKGSGLFPGARDDDGLPEQRQLFKPAQLRAQADDIANDDRGRRLEAVLVNQRGRVSNVPTSAS